MVALQYNIYHVESKRNLFICVTTLGTHNATYHLPHVKVSERMNDIRHQGAILDIYWPDSKLRTPAKTLSGIEK